MLRYQEWQHCHDTFRFPSKHRFVVILPTYKVSNSCQEASTFYSKKVSFNSTNVICIKPNILLHYIRSYLDSVVVLAISLSIIFCSNSSFSKSRTSSFPYNEAVAINDGQCMLLLFAFWDFQHMSEHKFGSNLQKGFYINIWLILKIPFRYNILSALYSSWWLYKL